MASRAERIKREREAREAAWLAEEARVRRLGLLFEALPNCQPKNALLAAMTDRIIDLYNEAQLERGDVLLEFLPNKDAHALLDWYFDENAIPTFTPPSATDEHEAPQQGQVSDSAQQPGGANGKHLSEADAEVIEIARDLVALWKSPNIQALPRADRNAAIEETRNRLIKAVEALATSAMMGRDGK